jgi:hypothetical protein
MPRQAGFGNLTGELTIESGDDTRRLLFGAVSIVPGLQGHEKEADVGGVRARQQTEPADRVVTSTA